jgi:predicted transcriptional regulator
MLGDTIAANSFIGGCKVFDVSQRQHRSLQTDLHINKILTILNENKQSKLFKVCHIIKKISEIVKADGITEEQAAYKLRKSVEEEWINVLTSN